MNIFVVGPSRSGKTWMATKLAARHNLTLVDIGQIVRLTTDNPNAVGGYLSTQGSKGTEWVDDIIDKSLQQRERDNIFVGYPRTMAQYDHIKGSSHILIAHMASMRPIQQRANRGRPDDANITPKLDHFYKELLPALYPHIHLFTTTDMMDDQISRLYDTERMRLLSK